MRNFKQREKIVHESQTDYPLKRVRYVKELMQKGLMTKEFYTMEENKEKKDLLMVHGA